MTNGSNGLKIQLHSPWLRSHRLLNTLNQTILSIGLSSSSPWPNTASHRVTCRQAPPSTPQRSSALPPVFFYPQQNRLILRRSPAPPSAPLSAPPTASPPAHKPCAPAPSELPLQLICPQIPTRSYPPSPTVETIEEVAQKQVYKPLRNIRKQTVDKKHGASIKMPRSQLPSFENYIEGPPISGGINMRFSRDEEPDAWYTTILNHTQKLTTGAIPNPTSCHAGRRHHFPCNSIPRCFDIFNTFSTFSTFDLPTSDLLLLPFAHLFFNRPLLVASNAPSDAPEPLFTSDLDGRC